jgi:hypothetical protein
LHYYIGLKVGRPNVYTAGESVLMCDGSQRLLNNLLGNRLLNKADLSHYPMMWDALKNFDHHYERAGDLICDILTVIRKVSWIT